MYNCSGKIRFPRNAINALFFNTKEHSSHVHKIVLPSYIQDYNEKYKSFYTGFRYNSSSSSTKRQKVIVTFQDPSLYPDNNVPLKKKLSIGINKEVNKIDESESNSSSVSQRYEKIMLKIDPYVKLMRIDKPIGTWLLFWPCGWSIMLAADPSIVPLDFVVKNLVLFLSGAFVMRGAGCTINDMWDRDIDKKVVRTKSRPLVNGQISMKNAVIFLGAQLSTGLAVLFQLNWYSVFLGASSMALVILYPLAKRVTDYPQLVLGLTFNWGALLGWSAIQGSVDPTVCLPLYGAGICWTLFYDTIYAHQDKYDDAIIGIKSTALKFNEYTKTWLCANAAGVMAGLGTVGAVTDMHWPYYASLGIIGMHMGKQILTLNKESAEDCSSKFVSNSKIGLILFIGIIMGKWSKIKKYFQNDPVLS